MRKAALGRIGFLVWFIGSAFAYGASVQSVSVEFHTRDLYRGINPADVLQRNGAHPLSLASADFDDDGVPDLAVGYDDNGRGIVAVFHGQNPVLLKPSEARFAPVAEVFELPEPADFLAAGDFDADGHVDIVSGHKGSSLLAWRRGDGAGSFGKTEDIDLGGGLTAFVSGDLHHRDLLPDLAVAVADGKGARVLTFESQEGALSGAPGLTEIPAAASRLTLQENEVIVDTGARQLLLDTKQEIQPGSVEASLADQELPSLQMRLNGDAIPDEVILQKDSSAPVVKLSTPNLIFYVNSTLDTSDANTGDSLCDDGAGNCTLRAALEQANASAGLDEIRFNIPGAGVQTITPATSLPIISDPVTIDGTTQPGASTGTWPPTLLIELNGTNVPILLSFYAGASGSVVRGLVVNHTNTGASLGLLFYGSSNNIIEYNLIGTNASGTASASNKRGIMISATAANNLIGGTTAANRNLISGNSGMGYGGITLTGGGPAFTGPSQTTIQGNYIGTNVDGTAAIGNDRGITLEYNCDGTAIGGTAAGAGNLISGNAQDGIQLTLNSRGVTIAGNKIGVDVNGTADLGNFLNGIGVFSASNVVLIGGTAPAARNIISGNNQRGIYAVNADQVTIQGNYIGTDVTGVLDLGNSMSGIEISQTTIIAIGGTAAGARNVISGNNQNGIVMTNLSSPIIQGNYIGVDAGGTADLGNTLNGILLSTVSNAVVGGNTTVARNVISGNNSSGITLTASANDAIQGNFIGTNAAGTAAVANTSIGLALMDGSNTNQVGGVNPGERNLISGNGAGVFVKNSSGNTLQGNYIGTNVSGTSPVPNADYGISIAIQAQSTVVGGSSAGAGNLIAFNGTRGVQVLSTAWEGNQIMGNTIYNNGQLGIDLGTFGVTPNDVGDGDSAGFANGLQNFPVLTTITYVPGTLTVSGTLNSKANTSYTLEFYANAICDPSGYGEGRQYLGSGVANTNGSGDASFTVTISATLNAGDRITATATDPAGNTSEFSACQCVAPAITAFSNTPVCAGSQLQLFANSDYGASYLWSGPNSFSSAQQNPTINNVTVAATGQYSVAATINGCSSSVANVSVTINANPVLTPSSLPGGTVSAPYSQVVTASGGSGPYAYAVTSGALPPGLTLNAATGEVDGTPTTPGTFIFQITATGSTGCGGSQVYVIVIACPNIAVFPLSMADGLVGAAYDQTLTGAGGTGPYTFTYSGTLPPGLNLSASGELSGTPTLSGLFSFQVTATDSTGCSGSTPYTLTINCDAISVLPATLPDATQGVDYSQQLTANGGTAPYTFSLDSGTLPAGITIDPDGLISGNTTDVGSFNFIVSITDAAACTKLQAMSLTVKPACLFCDDFEDGVLDINWTYLKGNWSENAGDLVGQFDRKAVAYASPAFGGCSTCEIQTTMMTTGGTGNFVALLGWYADKGNYVELLMKEEKNVWLLKQRANGVVVGKMKGARDIIPNTVYNVLMRYDGTAFSVFVDGQPVIALPAVGSPSGTVGFEAKATTGRFGSIAVN